MTLELLFQQLAWLIQADPFVLTHLRGLSRERVLRDLHRLVRPAAVQAPLDRESPGDSTPSAPDDVDDLVVAEDAAVRAACADLPPAHRPRRITFVETIATTGGKISRGMAPDRAAAGPPQKE